MTIDWKNALEAELSALRTAAIADAARIAELEASLAARGEARLRELVAVVVKGEVNHREFSMRIPAEHDRDADLVMNEAANRLIKQQAEIDTLKQQNAELLAVAQNVVDAHASTTHAIIAPTLEAFSRAVSDRQNHRDAAIYQLRQAIAKARGES